MVLTRIQCKWFLIGQEPEVRSRYLHGSKINDLRTTARILLAVHVKLILDNVVFKGTWTSGNLRELLTEHKNRKN